MLYPYAYAIDFMCTDIRNIEGNSGDQLITWPSMC